MLTCVPRIGNRKEDGAASSDMGLVARGVACAPRPRNPFGIALLAHPRPSMSMACRLNLPTNLSNCNWYKESISILNFGWIYLTGHLPRRELRKSSFRSLDSAPSGEVVLHMVEFVPRSRVMLSITCK